MITVSSDYKKIMSKPIRNRAFLSVGIGVINQNAQESGVANGDFTYWTRGNIFNSNQSRVEYATLEENYMKADGKMIFVPENDEYMQLNYNGITTEGVLNPIRIDFPEIYAIKGITLDFGTAYPLEFTIETADKTLNYTNNSESFLTMDVLGDTDYIIITPIKMVGGQQRFRIKSVIMGVGLQYSNEQTKSFSHKDFVSTISEELPSEQTNFSFYDEKGLFNVEDESSFIDYLETMQKITMSFGLEMDDGTVEWRQIATNYLKSWKSQKGIVSITATDKLSQMDSEYVLGNKIYTRTAYEEAESIFADAGLQPDEYFIDDYLNDVVLTNPMPIGKHKECLQLLANACRCIIRQNENGRILIQANFATVLDPEELTVSTNGNTKWSKPDNILIGSEVTYADLTKDFIKADAKMYFLPEDESYLETSYVSKQVADNNGKYNKNLIPYPYDQKNKIERGITFTVNENDGSITANGIHTTPGTVSQFYPILDNNDQQHGYNQTLLKMGKTYTFNGCSKGGSASTYKMRIITNYPYRNEGYTCKTYVDYGNGVTFTVDHEIISFRVMVDIYDSVNNLVFKPMIRLASDTDSTYQPYQENPKLTVSMPAAYTYFGVNVDFDGNPPSEMVVHTYNSNSLIESVTFKDLAKSNYLVHEFSRFDKMVFEFTKGYPLNRVLVNKISFGSLSDYVLTGTDMLENPIGYKERRTKVVRVKLFTFQNNEKGVPEEVEDNVFVEKSIHGVGDIKTLKNPLVSTEEHAETLAEWLGNYYGNNISYDVKYRGEPRINAGDVIHMESEKKNNLEVEVISNNISFNGSFSGNFELRRALRVMGD